MIAWLQSGLFSKPINMTIQAVFFDAAGTLIKPARRVGESYATIAAKHGKNVMASDIAERFRACFDLAPRLAFPEATEQSLAGLERDWWKQLVARVFEPWSPFERFEEYFAELFAYFAEPGAWALYPEVLETLSALQQRGLILGVISNFDSRLVRILDGLGAGSSFEQIFVSSRVGYAKPDPRIFHAALNRHGLRPRDAIHVGDSETNDLHGASNAGLRGVLVDRGDSTAAAEHDRVTSLKGILFLLND
jgi:putative hydrolase of the HAD superfamily